MSKNSCKLCLEIYLLSRILNSTHRCRLPFLEVVINFLTTSHYAFDPAAVVQRDRAANLPSVKMLLRRSRSNQNLAKSQS